MREKGTVLVVDVCNVNRGNFMRLESKNVSEQTAFMFTFSVTMEIKRNIFLQKWITKNNQVHTDFYNFYNSIKVLYYQSFATSLVSC